MTYVKCCADNILDIIDLSPVILAFSQLMFVALQPFVCTLLGRSYEMVMYFLYTQLFDILIKFDDESVHDYITKILSKIKKNDGLFLCKFENVFVFVS